MSANQHSLRQKRRTKNTTVSDFVLEDQIISYCSNSLMQLNSNQLVQRANGQDLNLSSKNTNLFPKKVNEPKKTAENNQKIYRERIRQLQNRLSEKNKLLYEKQTELLRLTQKNFPIKNQVIIATEKSQKEVGQNKQKSSESYQLKVFELESQVQTLRKKYAKINEFLQTKTGQFQQNIEQLEAENKQLNEAIHQLREEKFELENEYVNLRQEFDNLADENQILREKQENSKEKIQTSGPVNPVEKRFSFAPQEQQTQKPRKHHLSLVPFVLSQSIIFSTKNHPGKQFSKKITKTVQQSHVPAKKSLKKTTLRLFSMNISCFVIPNSIGKFQPKQNQITRQNINRMEQKGIPNSIKKQQMGYKILKKASNTYESPKLKINQFADYRTTYGQEKTKIHQYLKQNQKNKPYRSRQFQPLKTQLKVASVQKDIAIKNPYKSGKSQKHLVKTNSQRFLPKFSELIEKNVPIREQIRQRAISLDVQKGRFSFTNLRKSPSVKQMPRQMSRQMTKSISYKNLPSQHTSPIGVTLSMKEIIAQKCKKLTIR